MNNFKIKQDLIAQAVTWFEITLVTLKDSIWKLLCAFKTEIHIMQALISQTLQTSKLLM